MQRYFITLSYDGSKYHGWQIQPNGSSVQETLEKAISILLREPIAIIGAGRTDAGVHARLSLKSSLTSRYFSKQDRTCNE